MVRKSSAVVALLVGIAMLVAASCERESHGRFVVTQDECYACHVQDYDDTTRPHHLGLFSTDCVMCHTQTTWKYPHTRFPLEHQHAPELVPDCASCHTVGYARGDTPTTCVGCHRPAYDATTMPQHVLSGGAISPDCAACHDDINAGFRPSTFVHAWPLIGGHVLPTCRPCHGDTRPPPTPPWAPTYAGTPTTCFACHAADKVRGDATATDRNHPSYGNSCADCHDVVDWRHGVGGTHPEVCFPIAMGPHDPANCIDCHNPTLGSPAMGMNTDCVRCHSDAARDHRDVSGYPASPPTPHFCLDCHPTGFQDPPPGVGCPP